jgi:hypothetical protein
MHILSKSTQLSIFVTTGSWGLSLWDMTRSLKRSAPTLSVCGFLILTTPIFAGTKELDAANKDIAAEQQTTISQTIQANYSYVGGSDLKDGRSGSLGEQTSNFRYDLRMPVNDKVGVGFSIGYDRFDFSTPSGSYLPNTLETLHLAVSGRYSISNDWSVFALFGPRLSMVSGWDNIESQNVEFAGAVGAEYEYNPDFSVKFGLAINPGVEDIPVMPLLGVRWHFAPQWTLNAGFPRTALDYQVLTNLRLSIESSFMGGTYKTSSSYGNDSGNSDLNNRTLRYTEARVGIGALYSLTKNIDLQLSAGAIVYRDFDFKDSNYEVKTDPAPYVSTGIKVNF